MLAYATSPLRIDCNASSGGDERRDAVISPGASREAHSAPDGSSQPFAPAAGDAASGQRLLSPTRSLSESAEPVDEVLRSAFEHSPNGISVSAPDGRWLQINDAYCRMLGYASGELLGLSHADVTYPADLTGDREFGAAALAGEAETLEREKRYVRKDGTVLWARTRVEVVRDPTGEPLYFVSYVQDISEHRAAQNLFHNSERTLRSVIDNTPAVICVKGRDHRYTLVNRQFEQFYDVTRDWMIGRSDLDILPRSTLDDVYTKDQLVLDGGGGAEEEETILRGGEPRAMLKTRYPLLNEDGGIHGVCTVSTDITERRVEEREKRERLQCSELIYSALAQDRLVLRGQPIVHLASMQPAMVELLIRMRTERDSQELLAPAEFLPAAERFGLITVIDDWVVEQAVDLAAAGHRVAVNVSAKTISDPQQMRRISETVNRNGSRTENLVFEITETAVADNLEAARTFAVGMRDLGCAVALDDFGVGHGSFTYLRHLPIDYLKIDMQFVRDLLIDEEDRQVVQAIIGVAAQFKIETIAEGVEDQATLEELHRMGVDYVQGFWTGRPAPVPDTWLPPRNRRRGDRYADQV
jgi:PAS domain S-box-containing protein